MVASTQALRARRRRWRALQSQVRQETEAASDARRPRFRTSSPGSTSTRCWARSPATPRPPSAEPSSRCWSRRRTRRCAAAARPACPPRSLTALERWARGTASMLQAPTVVDDVAGVSELAGLPASRRAAPGLAVRRAADFRDRSLGVLVALAGATEGFLPRDVDLFQSYAAQAAIALTNARLYAAQEARASRDSLTGLLNHREFHETVARELERCRRYGGRMAVALFDLDDFKLVNDTGGHAEGDRVLLRVRPGAQRRLPRHRPGLPDRRRRVRARAARDGRARTRPPPPTRVQRETASLDRRVARLGRHGGVARRRPDQGRPAGPRRRRPLRDQARGRRGEPVGRARRPRAATADAERQAAPGAGQPAVRRAGAARRPRGDRARRGRGAARARSAGTWWSCTAWTPTTCCDPSPAPAS